MTRPAQGSIFSFAKQPSKIGSGTYNASSYQFLQFRAPRVAVGPIDLVRQLPPETGGPLTPTGAFKAGTFWAGDVDIIPRAEDDLGWMLFAAFGACSTTAVTGGPTGVNDHTFRFAADGYTLPWFATRRTIPGNPLHGETGYDCKIAGLRLTVPNSGLLALNMALFGRVPLNEDNPSWTYSNTLEDSTSAPLAGNGEMKINGVEYPFLGMTLEFNNGLTDPMSEMIVGELNPDDFVSLSRAVTIRLIHKYETPVLLNNIRKNGGANWSPLPFMTNTVGNTRAFEARFQSAGNLATNTPYEMRVVANSVVWQMGRPMEMVGGAIVTQEIIGTVQAPASGDYLNMILRNGVANYTW